MKKKICVISFDHWGYDHNIVDALTEKGIESIHIKIGNFKHKNFFHQITNSLFKIFTNKNPKNKKRQDYIIDTLKNIGRQDQILVISPETIDLEYHLEIKKFTSRYIAYLCDSSNRAPIAHLLKNVFDEIYSFDQDDVLKYNLKKTTNYIPLLRKLETSKKTIHQAIYIASFDKRVKSILNISKKLEEYKINHLFIIVGKKVLIKQILSLFKKKQSIAYRSKKISKEQMYAQYQESDVIFDLVRENQTGLSFRVFEAMALQKKLITDNTTISNYSFYNENNIFVINETNMDSMYNFFSTPYEQLPSSIYREYTVASWSDTIFGLKQ
ncbi:MULTISPECIES: hypothetical protein [unclassified Flavobacterium]|uniref:hypothetical protein n=1 Tax=unclassified Flavobacterium TaxID=196869 RepID=UPI00131D028C|nr:MULTISPECIES: hypothetical protein [unclassified Flavobacterium]